MCAGVAEEIAAYGVSTPERKLHHLHFNYRAFSEDIRLRRIMGICCIALSELCLAVVYPPGSVARFRVRLHPGLCCPAPAALEISDGVTIDSIFARH
jgi:hypothetical protein